jgi:hypothetical protein
MNALTTQMPLAYGDIERLASSIAQSGLFGIKTKDQAIVLMMIAHAEGRHPALAARDYDIINGRPAKKAEAMMRDFLEAGGKVEWHQLSDTIADATFTHPQTGSVRIDWDMERARTAFGTKDMYKKFPRQMLRSRVISEGVRTLWPLATSGFYEPGEAADIPAKDEHNGPTIEPDTRDTLNAEVPLKAVASTTPRAPVKRAPVDANDAYQAPPPPTVSIDLSPLLEDHGPTWLKNLETLLMVTATDQEEILAIGGHFRVRNTLADKQAPADVKRRVKELLANGYKRFAEPADDGTEAHEPETEGVA